MNILENNYLPLITAKKQKIKDNKQNIFTENMLCLNILVFLFVPVILKSTHNFLLRSHIS